MVLGMLHSISRWAGVTSLLGVLAAGEPLLLPAIPYAVVPAAASPAVIDGQLGDACWLQAQRIQVDRPALRPDGLAEGDPGSAGEALHTEALLCWRPDALLIAFRCHDSQVVATAGRKHDDHLYEEDVVEVFLDPVGDGRRYWEIQVSPRGQSTDALHVLTAEPPPTPSGRLPAEFYHRNHICTVEAELPGLMVAAATTPDGWNAELAIPSAALPRTAAGATSFAPGRMRLNLVRYDWAKPASEPGRPFHQATWSAVETGCPHQSAGRMGWIELSATAAAAP